MSGPKTPPHLKPRNLPPLRRRYSNGPLVICMCNEGGGTRKTVDAVNTCVSLAHAGWVVGVMDTDQTMAASAYLGYGLANRKADPERTERVYSRLASMTNTYDLVFGNASLKEALLPARTRIGEGDDDDAFATIPNLYLVLGSREMAQASDEIKNPRSKAHDTWLRRAVAEESGLDVLAIDCRGTFDTLEQSILAGSDYAIGCVKPDSKDDDTLENLKALIDQTRSNYEFAGGSAELRYVLLNGTQPENRGKFYSDLVEEVQEYYGDMVLPTIPETVQVAESVRAQEPVHYWAPGHPAAKSFDQVAQVLAQEALPDFSLKRWRR